MKVEFSLPKAGLLMFLLAGAGLAEAQSGQRLTREELIARRDASKERNVRLQAEDAAESQAHPSQSSILDRSVILADGRNWTFVPKGAVFCIPEIHEKRVNLIEGKGKYVPFASFAAKNRGWLSTYNVSLEQARGNSPINEEARKALMESGRVVISVCKGGPISTRPPKVEEATAKN